MIITFILGNGFDIQLGLLSRYSDFLREYIKISPDDNNNIKDFKKYLSQKDNRDLWSDAEIGMGKHLGQYSDLTIELYNERVRDFEINMIQYLKQQQERCSYSDRNQIADRFGDFLFNSFNDVLTNRRTGFDPLQNESNRYNFITFNYTDLLEEIKKCCIPNSPSSTIQTRTRSGKTYYDVWGSIFHVHGTIKNQIIMGVNDVSQLDLHGGVTLTESLTWELIKPTLNHESGCYFDLPAKEKLWDSDIIVIYGISYGDTDKLWWEEVVKWLRKSSQNKLVAFIRDQPNRFTPELAWTELDYEKNKRREILKKLHVEKNDPDFNALIEQIYIILNTTRLNLKEILIPQDLDDKATAASTNSQELVTV